jgi:predicted O-methyltransferase YrrM
MYVLGVATDLRVEGDAFEVDGARFCVDYEARSTPDLLRVAKPADLIEAYAGLLERCAPSVIVELGICGGGSTALLALLAKPRKLVAIELDPEPIEGLATFLHSRGLADAVRPYFGVDQGDRDTVATIVDREIGTEPIDLVIDDASHLLRESRVSFDLLFPRLRPGGLYVIEDWASHDRHAIWEASAVEADAAMEEPKQRPRLQRVRENLLLDEPGRAEPLSHLVVELVLARAGLDDAITDVSIDKHWAVVRRGAAPLDPTTFRRTDLYRDHFGLLGPAPR